MNTICYKPVTNRTRARKNGKLIKCPKCESVRTIYHFSWSGLTCPECKESIDNWIGQLRVTEASKVYPK